VVWHRGRATGMLGARGDPVLSDLLPNTNSLMLYFGLGALASVFEFISPARKLNYWAPDALLLDVVSWFFLMIVVDRYANFIKDIIVPIKFKPTQFLLSIPLWIRVPAYYLVGDLSTYWTHRMNHTKYMWRVHHFHHSITNMYWMSGVRDTVFQQLTSNIPYILWAPLLAGAPNSVFGALGFLGVATNHWMHMNFTWKSRPWLKWVEYILVTPRTHHIHHSSAPEHYNRNFGVVFGMWDHLFGTYQSPDTTTVTAVGAGTIDNPLQAAWKMAAIFDSEPTSLARRTVRRVLPFM
jgi:sterol desaturase/sphingolipid hydroxylase (fatty acid hydroxylase superfamily)